MHVQQLDVKPTFFKKSIDPQGLQGQLACPGKNKLPNMIGYWIPKKKKKKLDWERKKPWATAAVCIGSFLHLPLHACRPLGQLHLCLAEEICLRNLPRPLSCPCTWIRFSPLSDLSQSKYIGIEFNLSSTPIHPNIYRLIWIWLSFHPHSHPLLRLPHSLPPPVCLCYGDERSNYAQAVTHF